MRSTQDPIRGLQRYIEEWGLATEQELKVRFSPISHPTNVDHCCRLTLAATRQGGQGRG